MITATTATATSAPNQLPSPSPSPTRSHFHTPQSPLKHDPNPHPYAIKTTSTGLLTRSNSSPHSAAQGRHYYVPLSSPGGSRSRTGSMSSDSGGDNSPSPSPRRHRYSKSTTSDFPAPLAIPLPSPTQPINGDNSNIQPPTRRNTRRSIFPPPSPTSSQIQAPSLPSYPKEWTPMHLSTYLSTALRSQSGEALLLPDRVAKDISAWVREEGMSGKTFLALSEADLEGMHLSTIWRTALLSASRTLRQELLNGRIYVDSPSPVSRLQLESELKGKGAYSDGSFGSPDKFVATSNSNSKGYTSDSSSSSVDLSFASNLALPGEKDKGGRRYKYRTVGRSSGKAKGKAGGKVRGMVESWERSGSESEGGGAGAPSSIQTASVGSHFQPAEIPFHGTLASEQRAGEEDEEPSIETLISQSRSKRGKHDSWGARAWEKFDAAEDATGVDGGKKGLVTVKRVPVSGSVPDGGSVGKHIGVQDNLDINAGSVRRVFSGSSSRTIVGWEDDDDDQSRQLITVKNLSGPADDRIIDHSHSPSSKKEQGSGSFRSNGKGSSRRVVTAIFSAEPKSMPASIPVPGGGDLAGGTHLDVENIPSPPPLPPPEIPATAGRDEDLELRLQVELPRQRDAETQTEIEQFGQIQKDLMQPPKVQSQKDVLGPVAEVAEEEQQQREAELMIEIARDSELELELEADLTHTKMLVEVFTQRLDEVERKVEDMEERQRQRECEELAEIIHSRSISPSPTPTSTTASTGATLFTRALSYIYHSPSSSSSSSPSMSTDLTQTKDKKHPHDPPISALPSYVLLVSIGMCAIVLRVVFRRVVKGVKG